MSLSLSQSSINTIQEHFKTIRLVQKAQLKILLFKLKKTTKWNLILLRRNVRLMLIKPFMDNTYNHFATKNAIVNLGYIFSKGKQIEIIKFTNYLTWNGIDKKLYQESVNPPIDKNSYDNKMILRAIRYSYLSKYPNNQTLSLDSKGLKVYEK